MSVSGLSNNDKQKFDRVTTAIVLKTVITMLL